MASGSGVGDSGYLFADRTVLRSRPDGVGNEKARMNNDDALLQAYLSTTFAAFAPEGEIRIRVGENNPRLEALLSHHGVFTWAFITAFNPGSVPLDRDENELRQRRMENDLLNRGYAFLSGEGQADAGGWPPEPSVLILGIAREDAVRLGQEYGQIAIVVGEAMGLPQLLWIK